MLRREFVELVCDRCGGVGMGCRKCDGGGKVYEFRMREMTEVEQEEYRRGEVFIQVANVSNN